MFRLAEAARGQAHVSRQAEAGAVHVQGEDHWAGHHVPARVPRPDGAGRHQHEAGHQAQRRRECDQQQLQPSVETIPNTGVLFQIRYFKIRESTLHKLPDYIFMGLSIVHLMIYNSSKFSATV